MKAIRITAFAAGTVAVAWIASRVFLLVLQLVANRDVRGNYLTDGLGVTAAIIAFLAVFMLLIFLLTKALYPRRPVDRVLVVFGGYLGACLGAAFTLTTILWTAAAAGARHTPMLSPTFVLPATLYAGVIIGVFTLLPALSFIAVAEWIKVRAPVFYAIAGVAAAILAYVLYLAFLSHPGSSIGAVLAGLVFFGLPGLVGGLVYWGIAGRSTGQPAVVRLDGT
jgi:hypothetical protein